ncbi:TatD family hydrolase [Alkalihalobacterium chitinilyticum]|uniref:TatD family hydrolase n=1 Tax=Alkalihalobacterium chitinilyticum TaxID=2980103 RepID=A0ABT5VAQ9_9BACI|nr:TatD family hydrolase [Alkalihalobacterium chitinilyticum]MDE5412540.1 TatD family hydrolase [Alkalihalobacterium chitinilyticum]
MIDAHIHLYQYTDIEKRIQHWQKEGIECVVAVSNNLKSAYETLELKQRYPDFIMAGVGYHPEQKPMNRRDMTELEELIYSEKEAVSFIGEVGLPYYILDQLTADEQGLQLEQFARWVEVAKQTQLPLAVHAVHSQAEQALTLLKKVPEVQAHFHWLKAPEQVIKEIVAAGHFISVTPEICYRERDQKLAEMVPITQLLIETDGPWPFNGPFENEETSPLLLKPIAEKIADVKQIPLSNVIQQTITNTNSIYNLKQKQKRKS